MTRPALMPATTPDFMAPAWASALHWAIGDKQVRAAFEAATGRHWKAPTSDIDRMIDESTGAGRAYVEAFTAWFNENVWGDVNAESEVDARAGEQVDEPE